MKFLISNARKYLARTHSARPEARSQEETQAARTLLVLVFGSVVVQIAVAQFYSAFIVLAAGVLAICIFYIAAQYFGVFARERSYMAPMPQSILEKNVIFDLFKGRERRSGNERRTVWSQMRHYGRRKTDNLASNDNHHSSQDEDNHNIS